MTTIVLTGNRDTVKITDVLSRIARQCGVKQPSSWVTATREDHVEIRDDFFMEAIDDIRDRVDLRTPLGTTYTLTGDGSGTYDMPENFLRLHRTDGAVYYENQDRPVYPVSTDGHWEHIEEIGASQAALYYRLGGYEGNWELEFLGDLPSGDTVRVSYNTTHWMVTSAGVPGSSFTAEDDMLLLPRRLVESGAVWRWRERRGLPYQDKYLEYENLLARFSNDNRVRRRVHMGEREYIRWQDALPLYIPES